MTAVSAVLFLAALVIGSLLMFGVSCLVERWLVRRRVKRYLDAMTALAVVLYQSNRRSH